MKYSATVSNRKTKCTAMEVVVSSSAANTSNCTHKYTNKTAIFAHPGVILASISKSLKD